ncbi:MAG: PaaI family thioesterase, partial [bacterium]
DCRASLEVVPHLCSNVSGVRAGTLGMLIDVAAGAYATRAVAPNWVATCDMVVNQFAAPHAGVIAACPRLLRHGKSTIVVEVDVTSESQPDVLIGMGTVTFSILESRSEFQRTDPSDDYMRSDFAVEGSGLVQPVLDRRTLSQETHMRVDTQQIPRISTRRALTQRVSSTRAATSKLVGQG